MFSPSSSASEAGEAGFLPYREVHAHPCTRLLVATLTVLETAAVVPTLWLEQRLGHANHAVEQIVLRVALMLLRLYPIWRVLSMACTTVLSVGAWPCCHFPSSGDADNGFKCFKVNPALGCLRCAGERW